MAANGGRSRVRHGVRVKACLEHGVVGCQSPVHAVRSWSTGGRLAGIPQPWVRLCDDLSYRRNVTVRITRFWGIGQHYTASITEEDNPILDLSDPAEPTWRRAWDDEAGKGRAFFSRRYLSETSAKRWARRTLEKEFQPAARYEVTNDTTGRRWFYKEGD
jgi:hypothetical protein